MSGLRLIAAAALSLSGAASTVAPATAYATDEAGRETAIRACLGYNAYQPATLVEAVPDGMGDHIVWLEDKDGDLWLCNADSDGRIFANTVIQGDLLAGDGAAMASYLPAAERDRVAAGAPDKAEKLCLSVASVVEDVEIVATVEDGTGDYLVWLRNDANNYWMCDASADDKLYVFEPVSYSINTDGPDGNAPSTAGNNGRTLRPGERTA